MKTKPMAHQVEGGKRLAASPQIYGLACEQGTGKTWMLLDDIERQWNLERISGALVIAPKGVHANWVLREAPTHMSIPTLSHYYLSSSGKRRTRHLEKLLEHDGDELPILSMNVDALNTKRGMETAVRFLRRFNAMTIIDESQRIKNPKAGRSKKAYSLAELSKSRRIASGTMIANSPLDAFGQMEFLKPGLLGTTSYRAFVAEFAEVLPASSPLVQSAMEKSRSRFVPQIIKRDEVGRQVYRNLDKLSEMMAPYVYRVTKAECLDLPEKIYQTIYFELTPKERRVYDAVQEHARYEVEEGRVDIYNALTLIGKLRQATSGFIMVDGEARELDPNPSRMGALKELLEDCSGSIVIWATFNAQIAHIGALLRSLDISYVEYHGGIGNAQRNEAIDAFQEGAVRVFLGNPAAGGTGITLTAAETVIYYSCDFSVENRLQSEDRAHRIGTRRNVVYYDLAAAGTVDERVAAALQSKKQTALQVLDGL